MDLIYIILSIYLRLFQTALPLSRVSHRRSMRRPQVGQPLAMWIPLIGWVSVTVRYLPDAAWLAWRVTSVERLRGGPPSHPRRSDPFSATTQPTESESDRSDHPGSQS